MVLSSRREKVLMRKENQQYQESPGKTSRVWDEHRPCLAIRRALEILLSGLDGKMQADETRLGWVERLISEEVEPVRMEVDMFFYEYTDEEKEGK